MKNQNVNLSARNTLLVGALLLLTQASSRIYAQSSDALIDKLVSKGILTVDEAKDLRDQADNDYKTAFQAKTGMPDWVNGYKISGDFRGRYEQFSTDNNAYIDRTRLRYRLRFGITINMMDNMEAGFRLGSGDPTSANGQTVGNPLSQNSTFQGNFSEKSIYVDAAYGKWTAINSGDWRFSATVGKMDNPFQFSPMVFDPDLTPEGGAFQGAYNITDNQIITFTGAAFVLGEVASSTHDPFLFGGQVMWNAKWGKKWSSSVGGGVFSIVNSELLTTANEPYINQGNTREAVVYSPPLGSPTTLYQLKYQYNPVIADASVTYLADTFPLYSGAFPIKFSGEFMNNPGASQNNVGFWVGATFGQSGTKHTWDLTYRYEYLEADAWYDQLVDDDNGVYHPGDVPSANTTYGYAGGTNVKGHMIKFNYSITDSMTFSLTCYLNSLISLNGIVANPAVTDSKTSSTLHFMADLGWKF